jgi:predicted DNA-binding transcriptional regulator YafY
MPEKISFTNKELYQLALLCRVGLESVDIIDDKIIIRIWNKIESLLDQSIVKKIDGQLLEYLESVQTQANERYDEENAIEDEVDSNIKHQIEQAIENRSRLRIRYFAHTTGETTDRVIQPFEIIHERNGPYVAAFCELRQAERQFRLDAIEKILTISSPKR